MATPSSLGIQVQEERGPHRSIESLAPARTAFVGRTLRGPENRPTPVQSFADFQQTFGGLWQPSLLGYAVEHFFDNGGREALIVRVVNGARAATLTLPAQDGAALVLQALRPGTREYLRASVDYDNIAADALDEFNLTIQRVAAHATARVEYQETFRNLSVCGGTAAALDAALGASELVRLFGPVPRTRPRRTVDPATGQASGFIHSSPDGDDGDVLTDYDLIGSAVEHTGVFALDGVDHFSFLVIPPLSREADLGVATLIVAARYCRQRNAMLLVDPPLGWQTADEALAGIAAWGFASEDAFMYFPRILAHDKLRGRFETFAPSGAVAGMLARSEAIAPAWAAAEIEEPVLRPGYRPSCLVPERLRGGLAKAGINVLQAVRPSTPPMLPARTLAAAHAGAADWQHLATRRFALSLVASIAAGTREFALKLPYQFVEMQVRAYLEHLYEARSFGDRSRDDAFFVGVDTEDEADPEARRVVLIVGFAACRRGDYHSFRITHAGASTQIESVTVNRLRHRPDGPGDIPRVNGRAAPVHGGRNGP